jgi:hypothetical protein
MDDILVATAARPQGFHFDERLGERQQQMPIPNRRGRSERRQSHQSGWRSSSLLPFSYRSQREAASEITVKLNLGRLLGRQALHRKGDLLAGVEPAIEAQRASDVEHNSRASFGSLDCAVTTVQRARLIRKARMTGPIRTRSVTSTESYESSKIFSISILESGDKLLSYVPPITRMYLKHYRSFDINGSILYSAPATQITRSITYWAPFPYGGGTLLEAGTRLRTRQARPSNPRVGMAEHSVTHRMVESINSRSQNARAAATNNDPAAPKSKRDTTFL